MMGVDYSTVSVARKRLRGMPKKDRTLQEHFSALETVLIQDLSPYSFLTPGPLLCHEPGVEGLV
jgi:hypothetical protein